LLLPLFFVDALSCLLLTHQHIAGDTRYDGLFLTGGSRHTPGVKEWARAKYVSALLLLLLLLLLIHPVSREGDHGAHN